MIKGNTELWLGTESSLEAFNSYKFRLISNENFGVDIQKEVEKPSISYELVGGTAVINLVGALVNLNLPPVVANNLGITTYQMLQTAFYEAAQDEQVSRVILNINSPGGESDGLSATYEALKFLKSRKPVATFIDECHSAAYWLGSVGEYIVMSDIGTAGSIGAICTLYSRKAALEKEGVEPLVLRSVPRKALLGPCESFSEEGIKDLQNQLNYCHGVFVNAVAQNRKLTTDHVSSVMADGGVFYGQEAVNRRFVDALGTFQSLFTSWKPRASGGHNFQHGGRLTASTGDISMVLNSSGANVVEPQTVPNTTMSASNHAVAVTSSPQVIDATPSQSVEANAPQIMGSNTAQVVNTGTQPQSHMQNNMQTQFVDLTTKVAELSAQVTTLSVQNQELAATNKVLSAAVADKEQMKMNYTNLLQTAILSKANALGTEVVMPDDLKSLESMDKQLGMKFQAKFPAGGVAVTSPDALNASTQPAEAAWMTMIKNK